MKTDLFHFFCNVTALIIFRNNGHIVYLFRKMYIMGEVIDMATEMTLTDINPAQMLVLKSFAGVSSEEELSALMKTLKDFYAQRLEKELDRLWTNGSLDQIRLDELQSEHLRTPYRG